jgi:hypothetical protein
MKPFFVEVCNVRIFPQSGAQGFPVCGSLQCQNFLPPLFFAKQKNGQSPPPRQSLGGTPEKNFSCSKKKKISPVQKIKKKFSSFQRKKLLLKKES